MNFADSQALYHLFLLALCLTLSGAALYRSHEVADYPQCAFGSYRPFFMLHALPRLQPLSELKFYWPTLTLLIPSTLFIYHYLRLLFLLDWRDVEPMGTFVSLLLSIIFALLYPSATRGLFGVFDRLFRHDTA